MVQTCPHLSQDVLTPNFLPGLFGCSTLVRRTYDFSPWGYQLMSVYHSTFWIWKIIFNVENGQRHYVYIIILLLYITILNLTIRWSHVITRYLFKIGVQNSQDLEYSVIYRNRYFRKMILPCKNYYLLGSKMFNE